MLVFYAFDSPREGLVCDGGPCIRSYSARRSGTSGREHYRGKPPACRQCMSDDASSGLAPTLDRIAETLEWPQPGGERLGVGDRVRDRKRPYQTGTVVGVSDTSARDYYVEAIDATVAADNPDHMGSDPVVAVVWAEPATLATAQEAPSVYHFPASRLVAEPHVRDVPPSDLRAAPYHRRTFVRDENHNQGYIYTIRSQGYIESLLLARETTTGLELVEGHKRRWVAQEAGLDTVAVRVVDLNEWEAAVHYAQDHLPSMDAPTAQQTVWALAARWGDRIEDIPAITECRRCVA